AGAPDRALASATGGRLERDAPSAVLHQDLETPRPGRPRGLPSGGRLARARSRGRTALGSRAAGRRLGRLLSRLGPGQLGGLGGRSGRGWLRGSGLASALGG